MEPGQTVKEGETLVVMEAMKMEVRKISVVSDGSHKTAVTLNEREGGRKKIRKAEGRPQSNVAVLSCTTG